MIAAVSVLERTLALFYSTLSPRWFSFGEEAFIRSFVLCSEPFLLLNASLSEGDFVYYIGGSDLCIVSGDKMTGTAGRAEIRIRINENRASPYKQLNGCGVSDSETPSAPNFPKYVHILLFQVEPFCLRFCLNHKIRTFIGLFLPTAFCNMKGKKKVLVRCEGMLV